MVYDLDDQIQIPQSGQNLGGMKIRERTSQAAATNIILDIDIDMPFRTYVHT